MYNADLNGASCLAPFKVRMKDIPVPSCFFSKVTLLWNPSLRFLGTQFEKHWPKATEDRHPI